MRTCRRVFLVAPYGGTRAMRIMAKPSLRDGASHQAVGPDPFVRAGAASVRSRTR